MGRQRTGSLAVAAICSRWGHKTPQLRCQEWGCKPTLPTGYRRSIIDIPKGKTDDDGFKSQAGHRNVGWGGGRSSAFERS